MPKFRLQTLFILIILVVSLRNPYAVNVEASGRLADIKPAEDVSIYLPLVLNVYTSLEVTSVADVVNGDTSGPDALIANPGADGISLREAIAAANNGSGPITITFAAMLAGKTITLTSPLFVTGDGITLAGLSTSDGQPNIIIDGSGLIAEGCCNALIYVDASDFTLRHIRITGVIGGAISIRAGEWLYIPAAPPQVRNIRIEDNDFDNSGLDGVDDPLVGAIIIWTNPEGIANNSTIENVEFTGNAFRHYKGNGIILALSGTNNMIRDVTIQDNKFIDILDPLEITNTGMARNNQILGTKIIGNTFTNGDVQIALLNSQPLMDASPSSENVIADILILGNVFSGHWNSIGMNAGGNNANGNSILNVQIVNNLIDSSGCPIDIVGGSSGASDNHVEGVIIINNTVISPPLQGLRVFSNADGTSGNSVTGLNVLNTIFLSRPPLVPGFPGEFAGEITVDQVMYSITSSPGFAGINGNLSVDPKFIDSSQGGNFHLQPGSSAIDAGTSEGAPTSDLECLGRFDDPATPNTGAGIFTFYDIGAFEFNGLSTQCR